MHNRESFIISAVFRKDYDIAIKEINKLLSNERYKKENTGGINNGKE